MTDRDPSRSRLGGPIPQGCHCQKPHVQDPGHPRPSWGHGRSPAAPPPSVFSAGSWTSDRICFWKGAWGAQKVPSYGQGPALPTATGPSVSAGLAATCVSSQFIPGAVPAKCHLLQAGFLGLPLVGCASSFGVWAPAMEFSDQCVPSGEKWPDLWEALGNLGVRMSACVNGCWRAHGGRGEAGIGVSRRLSGPRGGGRAPSSGQGAAAQVMGRELVEPPLRGWTLPSSLCPTNKTLVPQPRAASRSDLWPYYKALQRYGFFNTIYIWGELITALAAPLNLKQTCWSLWLLHARLRVTGQAARGVPGPHSADRNPSPTGPLSPQLGVWGHPASLRPVPRVTGWHFLGRGRRDPSAAGGGCRSLSSWLRERRSQTDASDSLKSPGPAGLE